MQLRAAAGLGKEATVRQTQKTVMLWGVLILMFYLIYSIMNANHTEVEEIPFSEFLTSVTSGDFTSTKPVSIRNETEFSWTTPAGNKMRSVGKLTDSVIDQMQKHKVGFALMQEEGELAAARRASAARHFGDFIDLLTPEQRHMLGRRFEPSRRGPQGLPPEAIAKFDTDGDGMLNEAEHAEAHAEMRQHQERRRGRRVEARRKFDVNQNGQLEPEEREAMRAWLLEQGFDVQKIMDRPHGRQDGARRGPRGPGGPRSDQPGQRPPHPPESPLGNPPPDSPPA